MDKGSETLAAHGSLGLVKALPGHLARVQPWAGHDAGEVWEAPRHTSRPCPIMSLRTLYHCLQSWPADEAAPITTTLQVRKSRPRVSK